jgi:hypothetical protein
MIGPAMSYTGGGLNPLYDSAMVMDVALQGGATYRQGQVLGQVPGTGTAVNERQTITVTGTPTGGNFYLFYGVGQILIGPIAFNATGADVVNAINAALGTTAVQLTSGGPLPGTPVVVEFINEAAGMSHALLALAQNNLTGGATPTEATTRTQVGKPAGGYFKNYDDAAGDGSQTARCILQYDTTVNPFGQVTYGQAISTDIGGVRGKGIPAFFNGVFRCSDLIGLDANGVADLGRLIVGTAYTDAYAQLAVNGGG